MDSSTYRLLFGQITNSCVTYHYNFPGHNLLSPETLIEVSKNLNDDETDGGGDFLGSFPCYRQFPYSVQMSFPLLCGSGVVDYARELVESKLNWEMKLKKLRVSNINMAIDRIKKLRVNKVVALSRDLRRYIEHFYDDPEPMFSGNYNWLYTGGCLSYDDTDTTLISADCIGKKTGFYVSKLNNTLDEVEHKSFTPLKTQLPVLQIKSKGQQERIIVCVRYKNRLSLFSARRENQFPEMVKLWSKNVLNFKLLTSVDLKDDCNEVVLADSNLDIHVFHVERKNKINCYPGRKIASRRRLWSQVAFGNQNQTLYWGTQKCFFVFDLRDLNSGPKLEYNPKTVGEHCEEICSFVSSKCDSNFVYLATTHSALQVDLRNGKTVQKWTHMMKNSPQFVTSVKDEEGELLLLQSQTEGETVGIVSECITNGGRVNFLSRSLPYLLRGVKDSLNLAHLSGVCLNPFLGKRINFAVTGMECLKNGDGEVVLLTNNSGGDVFLRKIKKTSETGDSQPDFVERMKSYESHFENLHLMETTQRHAQLVDMSHLRERFSQQEKKKREKPTFRWKYEAMYSPESLKYYKDVIARKVLEVWGHGGGTSDEENEEDMSVDQKVREWMERC